MDNEIDVTAILFLLDQIRRSNGLGIQECTIDQIKVSRVKPCLMHGDSFKTMLTVLLRKKRKV